LVRNLTQQLHEAEERREQAVNINREQNKETETVIKELSQKHSRLTSEVILLTHQINALEAEREIQRTLTVHPESNLSKEHSEKVCFHVI
jgi:hypothetical protein